MLKNLLLLAAILILCVSCSSNNQFGVEPVSEDSNKDSSEISMNKQQLIDAMAKDRRAAALRKFKAGAGLSDSVQ